MKKPYNAGKAHPVKSNQVSRGTIGEQAAIVAHIARTPVKLKRAEGKIKSKSKS